MTVGVTEGRRIGAGAGACASAGNTAAALAAYAALAGLRALVIVPRGKVAFGKLAQALAYGARTLLVRGNFDECLELADQAGERLGVYLLNSVNPFRLEGQRSEEHTSELQSRLHLVCRLLLEKKKKRVSRHD